MRQAAIPVAIRSSLRTVRDSQPINWLLSSVLRTMLAPLLPTWIVKHLPHRGTTVVNLPGAGRVRFWSDGDDYITSRVWWMGTDGYEPETLEPFLRFVEHAEVVVDVGAYTGYYSLLAAAANPAARVFAFEPHARIAARLGHNLDLNPALNVTVLPWAVGARKSVASFYEGAPGLPLSSSLSPSWAGLHRSRPVAVTDLDSFAAEWRLERVDVVKIDVESTEAEVIKGMTRLLGTCRPVLFMEVLPGESRSELSAQLRRLDYELYYLTFDGPVRERELASTETLLDHARTPFNHLLCPAEKVPAWLH